MELVIYLNRCHSNPWISGILSVSRTSGAEPQCVSSFRAALVFKEYCATSIIP